MEAIEADLPAHYPGVRLKQLFTGGLTRRELLVYLKGLPATSRLRTALRGGEPAWGLAEYQLADIFDALARGNWQRGNAGAKSPGPQPPPYPRPVTAAQRERDAQRERARADALARAHAHAAALAAAGAGAA